MVALTKIKNLPYAQPATFLGLIFLSTLLIRNLPSFLSFGSAGNAGSYLWLLPLLLLSWETCNLVFERKIYLVRLPMRKGVLHVLSGFAVGLFVFLVRNGLLLTGQNFRDLSLHFADRFWSAECLYLLLFAALIAVVEEGTFRGYFFPAIENAKGPMMAFWFSAITFGLFHIDSVIQINDFIEGLMLAFLVVLRAGLLFTAGYWWQRSLFFCVGLHMGVDFTGMFIFGDHTSQIAPLTQLHKSSDVFLMFGKILIGYAFPAAIAFVFVWLARRRDAARNASNKQASF